MKMRNYIKKQKYGTSVLRRNIASLFAALWQYKLPICFAMVIIFAIPFLSISKLQKDVEDIDISESTLTKLTGIPVAATARRSVITIPAGIKKENPFVPYGEAAKIRNEKAKDIPAFTLVEPPEVLNENSDAARVMDTIVSGILYDKYSPSAILNIEGSDYLVKKGDVVNNYKVISIMQDSVTVQLGANTYKAGIGEILTEGNLNHNDVSNLNNKFGGEKR